MGYDMHWDFLRYSDQTNLDIPCIFHEHGFLLLKHRCLLTPSISPGTIHFLFHSPIFYSKCIICGINFVVLNLSIYDQEIHSVICDEHFSIWFLKDCKVYMKVSNLCHSGRNAIFISSNMQFFYTVR